MKKRKTYEVSVINKTYSKTYSDQTKFYTSDTALELNFQLKEVEYDFDSAEIILLNIDDRSLVTRPVAKNADGFTYELEDDIVAHYGEWKGQLKFNEGGEIYVSSPVSFRIENDLTNDRPPQLTDIRDWETLRQSAKDLIAEMGDVVANEAERIEAEKQRVEGYQEVRNFIDNFEIGENAVGTENIKNDAVTADKTTFLAYNNIYTPSKIKEGKFLQSNGVLVDHQLYDVTDFEDVLPNEDYETNSHRLSVFYNGSKDPIGFLDSSNNVTNTNTILSTPDKTRFMRTNILKTERANYKLYPINKKFILSNEVAFKVGSSELDIVQDKNILVKENVSVGKFINNDGTLTSIPSYYTTDFMPFKEGDYDFNVHRRSVFYDEQKNIIGYIDSGSILRGKIPISAPANTAFIRTSVPDTDWDTFSIYARSFSVLEFTDEIQLPTSTPTISPETKSEWDGKNAITFGTSISWQDGKAYTQSSEIGKIARGYQTHLREKLGLSINNQGVSGSRIVGSDGTRILAETFDFKPYDLVIFEIGTNDFKLNTPLGVLGQMGDTNFDTATFIGAYRHLIEYVLTSNPNIKIVLFTPLQRDNGGYDVNTVNEAGHRLIDYANAARALEEMYSLRLVDMYKNSGFNKLTLSTYTMDGLHPNDIGYDEMGGLAVKEIDQINS